MSGSHVKSIYAHRYQEYLMLDQGKNLSVQTYSLLLVMLPGKKTNHKKAASVSATFTSPFISTDQKLYWTFAGNPTNVCQKYFHSCTHWEAWLTVKSMSNVLALLWRTSLLLHNYTFGDRLCAAVASTETTVISVDCCYFFTFDSKLLEDKWTYQMALCVPCSSSNRYGIFSTSDVSFLISAEICGRD